MWAHAEGPSPLGGPANSGCSISLVISGLICLFQKLAKILLDHDFKFNCETRDNEEEYMSCMMLDELDSSV